MRAIQFWSGGHSAKQAKNKGHTSWSKSASGVQLLGQDIYSHLAMGQEKPPMKINNAGIANKVLP